MDNLKERFLAKVYKTDKCWLWTASIRAGYGVIRIEGKLQSSHRISYSLFVCDVPKNFLVCHKCDVRRCVNPKHLFLGTYRDNMLDSMKKGRKILRGEELGNAKLKRKEVDKMRDDYKKKPRAFRFFAEEYNVSKSTIRDVISRKIWK